MDKQYPHSHDHALESYRDMPEKEEFLTAAERFRLLGDPSRVRIFWILCHGEECVINLSAMMGMSSPAVSHHLRLLRATGLLTTRREGKEVYYRAADTAEAALLHTIIEEMVKISCPPKDR